MQMPEAPPASPPNSAALVKILLVDDSEANLLALESCLEELGETLVRAKSAQEALGALLKEEFALILLDVRMPDMDGFELARFIRQQGRLKDVPIIFISALEPRRGDIELAYELGVVDYVVKPVTPIVLKTKARVFVELFRSRIDLARRVAERTAELEKAALTLRTSETRLRLLVDQGPAVQWTTDADLRITMSVGSGLAVLGLKPGQLVGTLLRDFVGPGDPSVAAHEQALAGQSASYEGVYNGRQFESNVEPLRDDRGTVIGVVGVSFDRTERRAAEQTVKLLNEVGRKLASELDLEKLVQSTTDIARELVGAQFGAFFYNVQNEKGESYLLYTLSGVPREAFSKFPMPRNTAIFAPTFSGQGVVRSDDIRKDPRYGKSPPHHGMPAGHLPVVSYLAVSVVSRTREVLGGLFFGHGEPARFTSEHERLLEGIASYAAVAIENARLYRRAQDELAERRRAERELAYQHELTRSIAEKTADPIFMTDERGRATYANPEAVRVFGFAPDELRHQTLHDAIHHHYPDGRAFPMPECPLGLVYGEGRTVRRHEDVFFRKDGTAVPVLCSNAPLEIDGRRVGALLVIHDLTEQKRARAQMAEELAAMTRLQEVSARLVRAGDVSELQDEILGAAIETTGADMGNVQLLEGDALRIVAQHGFEAPFLEFFGTVHGGQAACGRALSSGGRVVVEDVAASPVYDEASRRAMLEAGARACQSTPLISRSGRLLGMLSTHYRESRRPSERALGILDILCRQAADLLERAESERSLRESREELAGC